MQGDLYLILPEILLAAFAMVGLLAGAYGGQDKLAQPLLWATVAVLALLGFVIALGDSETGVAFGSMVLNDGFARFTKVMILWSAAVVLLMSEGYMARRGLLRFEYPLLVALACVGMMIMVSAGDLMAL